MAKLGNVVKIVGLMTVIGTVLAKLLPLLQKEHPKLKKKITHIGDLLVELKDEVVDLGALAQVKKSK